MTLLGSNVLLTRCMVILTCGTECTKRTKMLGWRSSKPVVWYGSIAMCVCGLFGCVLRWRYYGYCVEIFQQFFFCNFFSLVAEKFSNKFRILFFFTREQIFLLVFSAALERSHTHTDTVRTRLISHARRHAHWVCHRARLSHSYAIVHCR